MLKITFQSELKFRCDILDLWTLSHFAWSGWKFPQRLRNHAGIFIPTENILRVITSMRFLASINTMRVSADFSQVIQINLTAVRYRFEHTYDANANASRNASKRSVTCPPSWKKEFNCACVSYVLCAWTSLTRVALAFASVSYVWTRPYGSDLCNHVFGG